MMIACTRCGEWHTNAEKALNRHLSCTEVKQYWAKIRNDHRERYGHIAQFATDESGTKICFKCKRKLELPEELRKEVAERS